MTLPDRDFKYYVDAVLDNNKINDGQWSDWHDATDIFDVYGEPESNRAMLMRMLNYSIYTNGECVQAMLEFESYLMFGVVFNYERYGVKS